MSRSQRHKVIIQSTDSSGKGLSEKQPALRYINQYANSQAFTVPIGPSGGPLQGSSVAGFPPTLIPLPGVMAERDGELSADKPHPHGGGAFTDPGQFDLSGNPIYVSLPDPGTTPPGETFPPEETPVLDSLLPDSLALSDDSTPVTFYGSNFDDGSEIIWNLVPVQTTMIDDTRLTTNVDPATATAGTVPVFVRRSNGAESATLDFTFIEFREGATIDSSGSELPEGPITVAKIEIVGDYLLITLASSAGLRTRDWVRIEASGNSALNGDYQIGTVKDNTISLDRSGIDLAAPIVGRGRITFLERD